jgi:hypothetical protein
MSFLPDLTPLINQIKEFNQNQVLTNQLLTQILTELKKDNSQIKTLKENK